MDSDSTIKDEVFAFINNEPAYKYLEEQYKDAQKKNDSAEYCAHVDLGDGLLLCIQQLKDKWYNPTGSMAIYFREGILTTDANKAIHIEYKNNEIMKIPVEFYVIGINMDVYLTEELSSFRVFPVFENKYFISKGIADEFVLYYKEESVYKITFPRPVLYIHDLLNHKLPIVFNHVN